MRIHVSRGLLVWVLSICFCWGSGARGANEPSAGLKKSVVLIRSVSQGWNYDAPWQQSAMRQGAGTGFIIAGKRILTNAHNVSDCRYVEIKKQDLAKRYIAQIAFIEHDCDLAVLTVEDATFFDGTVALELGDIPQVNTTVQTYGFPVGGQDVSVTEGVVSRIQMDRYSHTMADVHLVVQTDAAINPGNSGGPVMQNGKVVGVAFQGLRQADNIGYMIPTTVIRHFLTDIEDGHCDGYGSLGFSFYPGLHSRAYKRYLQVPADEDGVVVLSTLMHSSVENLLQRGDVITAVGGHNVDNDGRVQLYGLTLSMSEVIEQKQIGEKVSLTFYRQGEKKQAQATVALNRGMFDSARQYDKPPHYVVFAGLVFMPVSRNFLETWGKSWPREIPANLRYLVSYANMLNKDRQRKEYVVLSAILPDAVNAYCDNFRNGVVNQVNNEPVRSLEDLYQSLTNAKGEFINITFRDKDMPLVLRNRQARQQQDVILKKYQIPEAARL